MASKQSTPASPSTSDPGRPPDLTSYREIHRALRRADDQLVAALEALPASAPRLDTAKALRRWFAGYRGELIGHHDVEDTVFFPALADRVPAFAEYAASLDADHHRLDALLDSLSDSVERLVSGSDWAGARADALDSAIELRSVLAEHLDVEDRDILPMFVRHFEAGEYEQLNDRALKSVSVRQALFTAPWFMDTVPPEVAAHTLAESPLALKVVYRLTRRRYARLVAAAFGARS